MQAWTIFAVGVAVALIGITSVALTLLYAKRARRAALPLEVNLASALASRGGRTIPLTETEWRLLACLASRQGAIVVHEEILVTVFGQDFRDDDAFLQLWISRLRRKVGCHGEIVLAHAGIGYSLATGGVTGGTAGATQLANTTGPDTGRALSG